MQRSYGRHDYESLDHALPTKVDAKKIVHTLFRRIWC
jgi:hypothetical protein